MISNKKLRPENGPGSNGLRGGQNTYSGKTAIKGWLDDVGGAVAYKRGFHNVHFQTEAQQQQLGATLKGTPLYGAGLPVALSTAAPTASDNFSYGSHQPSQWTTTTRVMSDSIKNPPKESFVPSSSMVGEDLEKYRQSWTLDPPIARNLRYQTELRRSTTYASDRFQPRSVRFLPGTPQPLERFRERLIERHGILSFCALRKYIGSGVISCNDLRTGVNKLGIVIKPAEFSQIAAYFTPSDSLNADDLIRTVIARTDGFDPSVPADIFVDLFGGKADVGLAELSDRINPLHHPEVAEGLQLYLDKYMRPDGVFTLDEFVALHTDLYAGAPDAFADAVTKLWR